MSNMGTDNGPRPSSAIVDLVHVIKPSRVLEFGSWQGRSALRFLSEMEQTGILGTITCVDTWLGSPEHWIPTNNHPEWGFQNLSLRDGEPQILEQFWENIRNHGFENQTSILRCSTISSEGYLRSTGQTFELSYIDADHSTKAVEQDILTAMRISPNGIVAGDDWCWPSVQLGVAVAARKLRLRIYRAPDDFGWVLLSDSDDERSQDFQKRNWKRRSLILTFIFVFLHRSRKAVRKLLGTRN